MMQYTTLFALLLLSPLSVATAETPSWTIDTKDQWAEAALEQEGFDINDGFLKPKTDSAVYTSVIKRFDTKRKATSLTFKQSDDWLNWEPVANVGPVSRDAPILLSIGPGNYWFFALPSKKNPEKRGLVDVPGYDRQMMTTAYQNQFDHPDILRLDNGQKMTGIYHAWHSRDMKIWVNHGPILVSSVKGKHRNLGRWSINAEYADGKAYIYYDHPNDQDPHLVIDDDLFDVKPGRDMGLVFADPSNGSDAAVIRDLGGKFHIIYEDWSPIDASKNSWDSPLAGHAVSADGITNFEILPPAVDERTTPTGKKGTHKHPHWMKEHPDFDSNIVTYEIHEPKQNAYGDWAAISIGGQYYLFGDFDPSDGHGREDMSVAWFTSPSLDEQFRFCGHIGSGHPDPDIAFAEGQFYLVTQQETDFVSSGPWVETVEARVGVDSTGNGAIDQWTDWSTVSESYDHIPGFAKQIKRTPAQLNLDALPSSQAFQFEFRTTKSTKNGVLPVLDSVVMDFK